MYGLACNDASQKPGRVEISWRVFLSEEPRKGSLNDFPTEIRGRMVKKFNIHSVQNVQTRVGVKLEDFSADGETTVDYKSVV